jgi:hypothetical protein
MRLEGDLNPFISSLVIVVMSRWLAMLLSLVITVNLNDVANAIIATPR